MGKWLQLLNEAAPGRRQVGLMVATSNAVSPTWYRMFRTVAPTLGIEAIAVPMKDPSEVEGIIKSIARRPNSALIVPGDLVVSDPAVRRSIVDLAATLRLPALYGEASFAADGGLIAYGIDRRDAFRRAASYVDRILKGEKPADLPVQQPTKFHFVINLKAAKALGLDLYADLRRDRRPGDRIGMLFAAVRIVAHWLPAQPVDATPELNPSAGVSSPRVSPPCHQHPRHEPGIPTSQCRDHWLLAHGRLPS